MLTEKDAVEFMCVALRHAEYKPGTSGPLVSEIMDGFRRIGLLKQSDAECELAAYKQAIVNLANRGEDGFLVAKRLQRDVAEQLAANAK